MRTFWLSLLIFLVFCAGVYMGAETARGVCTTALAMKVRP